jgi:hypothetical protein
MSSDPAPARQARTNILAHLRTLRLNLSQARDTLMHYKADRIDRDNLEPAARRVDDLMNMFASDIRNPDKAAAWVSEILVALDQVTNVKVTAALGAARTDIAALREEMQLET